MPVSGINFCIHESPSWAHPECAVTFQGHMCQFPQPSNETHVLTWQLSYSYWLLVSVVSCLRSLSLNSFLRAACSRSTSRGFLRLLCAVAPATSICFPEQRTFQLAQIIGMRLLSKVAGVVTVLGQRTSDPREKGWPKCVKNQLGN